MRSSTTGRPKAGFPDGLRGRHKQCADANPNRTHSRQGPRPASMAAATRFIGRSDRGTLGLIPAGGTAEGMLMQATPAPALSDGQGPFSRTAYYVQHNVLPTNFVVNDVGRVRGRRTLPRRAGLRRIRPGERRPRRLIPGASVVVPGRPRQSTGRHGWRGGRAGMSARSRLVACKVAASRSRPHLLPRREDPMARQDPLRNFRFRLEIDGLQVAGF